MVTIQVIQTSTGKPVYYQRVVLGFSMGNSKPVYTDKKGEAHFDYPPRQAEVYVNGKVVFNGKIEGRTVVYI